MSEGKMEFERRKDPRKSVNFVVLLKIGFVHQGRGHTKNISISGIRIEAPSIFARIRYDKVSELIGSPIKIAFPQESLTIQGEIVRAFPVQGEIAVSIKNTSNEMLWKKMCSQDSGT